ncbi:UDP-glycosyltransferase [Christiangramia sp. ASW11-125]|uniref:UDP-glycosyltransferase n=1 Tax=Christiangramia sp. ASW11-125 TaxID=3400701 RepID=UPI003AAF8E9A
MRYKKLLVIIPDGVSLKNFAYTDFPIEVKKLGWDLVYLNLTNFDLTKSGIREVKIIPKPKRWTDLLKRAKILVELDHFQNRFNDPVYNKYKFGASKKGIKNKVKNFILRILFKKNQGKKGLNNLRFKIQESEKGSAYYLECIKVFEDEKPDMVLCASQRPVKAVAPILASQKLNIPTACFIFSWDNLPKATKIIDTDYYFVWSDFMKEELKKYYPYINDEQVRITGSPQFEIHYKKEVIIPRHEFFERYALDINKNYICFSGDDITTSPHDELFLLDLAEEVEELNKTGNSIGIIFRRCPVDLSGRYDFVLDKFKNLIVPIEPEWTSSETAWNEIMPKKEDLILQTNIIEHSFMVINVGSSMIFDFAAKEKPCAYISYIPRTDRLDKDIQEVYNYVHFRSMPTSDPVYWIRNKSDYKHVVLQQFKQDKRVEVLANAVKWSNIINQNMSNSSQMMIKEIEQIIE